MAGKRRNSTGTAVIARITSSLKAVSAKAVLLWIIIVGLIIALIWQGNNYRIQRQEIAAAQSEQKALYQQYHFDPGYIITDSAFYDSNSLTVSQIQTFLTARGKNCRGKFCLSSYSFRTFPQKADDLCKGYDSGSGDKKNSGNTATAARIIDAAARSCGISQKVLVVMLEKEQGLVTSSGPTRTQVNTALGLSCPDNGKCDSDYLGFFKQVYGAAHRFKYYAAHPSRYPYHSHSLNYIRYNPKTRCGGSTVYIYNDATALLYTYTPYQPNAAALKAGLGTGDSCSSYGNRNFFLLYKTWFGNPLLD